MYLGNFLESLLHEMNWNMCRFTFHIGKTQATFEFWTEMKNIPIGKLPAKNSILFCLYSFTSAYIAYESNEMLG